MRTDRITRAMFDAAATVAQAREGSRASPGLNDKHPETQRSYRLRSFVLCDLCGCRMFGKTNRADTSYYVCQPSLNLGSDAKRRLPDHPPTVWVRDDALLAPACPEGRPSCRVLHRCVTCPRQEPNERGDTSGQGFR
jgi:hypothetical protein